MFFLVRGANTGLRIAGLTDTTSRNHRKDCCDVTSRTARSVIRREKKNLVKSLHGGFDVVLF